MARPRHQRPRTYGDCADMPMPCPWVSCRYHLLLDTTDDGAIVVNDTGGSKRAGRGFRRKLPVWGRKVGRAYDADRAAKIVEHLEAMEHTCILKLVDDGQTYTLEEVGEILSVTRERIRQIETIAIARIRAGTTELEPWADSVG